MNIILRIVRDRIEELAEARANDPVGCAHLEQEEQSLRSTLAKLESVPPLRKTDAAVDRSVAFHGEPTSTLH